MMFTVLYFPNKVKLWNFRLKAYFLAHEQQKSKLSVEIHFTIC